MIKKATELDFKNKKIKMILAGFPGIGKTTLALSAPKPLLIDLDDGVDRVEARYRTDTDIVEDYDELINDLTTQDLSKYETIVIDTGGRLFDLIKPKVILEEVKNGQKDGSLTLKGYGAAGRKFLDFLRVIDKLNKHLVIIFHAREEKDGDATKLRIMVEGSTKDVVWQSMDLGGFMEMSGKKRTIGFSNCERYYAKGTHGIKGIFEIPELTEGVSNTFISDIFAKVIKDLQAGAEQFASDKQIYEEAMSLKNIIAALNSAEQVNQVVAKIGEMKHALTSEKELKFLLNSKAKELGLVYSKEAKAYVPNNG